MGSINSDTMKFAVKEVRENNFEEGDAKELKDEMRQEFIDAIPSAAYDVERLAMLCNGLGLSAGWWHDAKTKAPKPDRNFGDICSLMHSEISEAYEAHRKDSPDDHLPGYPGKIVELADLAIRLFDWVGKDEETLGLFMGAFVDKLKYNTERADHKMDARAAEGGKKL